MSDDIVTRLQSDIAFRLRLQAKVSNLYEIHHPHMIRVPTIYEEAADEIERLRASVINTFDNGFDEIERLQHQNKIMADLLWHFMQNTDENLNANLCILHRAAQKLAIKGDG